MDLIDDIPELPVDTFPEDDNGADTRKPEGWEQECFGVREGSRNDSLARLAGQMIGKGLSMPVTHEALIGLNNNFDPPLHQKEVESILNSIWKIDHDRSSEAPSKLHYKITTIDEILNYPEPKYLVDPIIIEEILIIIASYAGIGKSILALSIAKAFMTGQPLWGKFPVSGTGTVLLIDEETPRPFLKERILRMHFDRNLPFPVIHFQGVKIDTDDGMEALGEALDKVKPKILIIDSFIRIHSADENKTKDMAKVMDKLRRIVNQGITVILIAHHGKGQDRPAEEKLRGVSEIPAGIDIEYSIVDKSDGEAGVKILEFKSVKTRTKPVEPILLKLTFPENPDSEITVEYQGTKTGDTLKEIKKVLREKEIDGKPISEVNGAIFSKIEDWLEQRKVKVGEKNLRSVLKIAVKNGEILSKQDRFARGKPVVYWMPVEEPGKDDPSWVNGND